MNLYCIIFPNKKKYFGVETHNKARWRVHQTLARKPNPKWFVHRAMKKYGIENCRHRYIYKDIDREYCLKLEKQFIKSYKTTDPRFGYNISKGGDGTPGVRKEVSEGLKRYYASMTPEQREAYRKTHGERMRKLHTGRKYSPEVREKFRLNSLKQGPKSPEYLKQLSERKKKWWADRKAAGITGNIAYTKSPRPPSTKKPKPHRDFPYQRLKPVTDEHRQKVAEKKRQWWIARKASGLPTDMRNLGKIKQVQPTGL